MKEENIERFANALEKISKAAPLIATMKFGIDAAKRVGGSAMDGIVSALLADRIAHSNFGGSYAGQALLAAYYGGSAALAIIPSTRLTPDLERIQEELYEEGRTGGEVFLGGGT